MFERNYDLVVSGAGVAGIVAALASARRGLKTILLEKTVLPGGLATTGLVYIYLPLCDGNGTQVSFGITEEMINKSLLYGPGDIPENWRNESDAQEEKRYRSIFSPASFMLALDEMLEEANVDVWYDTVVTDAETKDNQIHALEVYNKSGKGKIYGKFFVDATGDSDIAVLAHDSVLTDTNALACWTIEYRENCNSTLGKNCRMHVLGVATDKPYFEAGVSGKDVTKMMVDGRKKYRQYLCESYEKGENSRKTHFPLKLPAMAQFRHTRCFDAPFVLKEGMQWQNFDDSIGMVGDWRKAGSVWEIPYRTLLSKRFTNLFAAGRCTAAEGDAWEITRVIPTATLTGEVAGVAAALALNSNTNSHTLDYNILAEELRNNCNFKLHFKEVGL